MRKEQGHKNDTKSKALKVGRDLLQKNGYNGFSFQHIADRIGLKKPSLYDHFESKEFLVNKVIENYRDEFKTWSASMSDESASKKIENLFVVYYFFAKDRNQFCPVSALASDYRTLPRSVQINLSAFTEMLCDWLANVISSGQKQGEFKLGVDATIYSQTIVSTGLGVQLLCRLHDRANIILQQGQILLDGLRL